MKRVTCTAICLTLLMTTAAAMTGCRSGDGGTTDQGASERAVTALRGAWTLEQIEGDAVAALLPEGSRAPFISVDEAGRVTGFGGVNRLSSSLDIASASKGQWRLSPVITTKMAGPAQAMNLESRFVSLLGDAGTYEIDDQRITLFNGDRRGVLRFLRR